MTTHYLACDLGAESGRLMLGSLTEGHLSLAELHRFPNTPLRAGSSLHWNISNLLDELKQGLGKAGGRGLPISSISADSWGVDYFLFSSSGTILAPTFHYRDPRTQLGVERALKKVDWKAIFAATGVQFMVLNTLFQLAAEAPERLAQADLILGIGDGINFFLGGKPVAEESIASTFQLYDPRARSWSDPLIQALGFPKAIFPPIVPSGTRTGFLRDELAQSASLPRVEVVASCSHDTAAAVAAVPASGADWAYLSSGTWSLMGVELTQPIITDSCRELNFTNEIGYGGSVRLLKNIIGLWLVQECRRHWAQHGQDLTYATLANLAADAEPFACMINPADERFLAPDDMPLKIRAFCEESGQAPPANPGATIRCILESLALLYRRTLLQIEQLIGHKVARLHVVGGGSKNQLLNEFTANALQIPVIAGPVEATAAGNILVQAIALGHLASLEAARAVVRRSLESRVIEPGAGEPWLEAYDRFNRWFATPNRQTTS